MSAGAAPLSCPPSGDERPSAEPLGAGVRVYACLFEAVGDVIQARGVSFVLGVEGFCREGHNITGCTFFQGFLTRFVARDIVAVVLSALFLMMERCVFAHRRTFALSSRSLKPPACASAGGAGAPHHLLTLRSIGCDSTDFQAVVRSEAKPFGEARSYLPALKAATKWAAIEQSWGYARALASELSWRRDIGAPSSPSVAEGAVSKAGGASAAAAAAAVAPTAGASPSPAASAGAGADAGVVEEQDVSDLYCICRGGDYGGVMVECDACSEWYHAAW